MSTVPEPIIEQHESDDEFFDSLFPDPPDPFPNLPATLKQIPNWISWKLEEREGKQTKVPYVVGTTRPAAVNNPADWVRFKTAIGNVPTINANEGLGFVINGKAASLGLVGFDIDGCRNPQTSEITDWAWRLIKCLHSYTEVTPSGTGVRVWAIGDLPEGRRVFSLSPSAGYGDKVRIEVFCQGRYFTITGNRVGDAIDIEKRDLSEAYRLCEEIKRQLPAASKASQRGCVNDGDAGPVRIKHTGSVITTKLHLLLHGNITQERPLVIDDGLGNSIEYPSHSEADLALATWLAIDGKDAEGTGERAGHIGALLGVEFDGKPVMRGGGYRGHEQAANRSRDAAEARCHLNVSPGCRLESGLRLAILYACGSFDVKWAREGLSLGSETGASPGERDAFIEILG